MASIGISASTQRACSTQHVTKKQSTKSRPGCSQATNVVTPNIDGLISSYKEEEKKTTFLSSNDVKRDKDEIHQIKNSADTSRPRFSEERWRNGTWDLSMFVKQGRMDWDSLITAEARRRKILELYPEASTNEEPVIFRSSVIPWWAWIARSHLPEAELLNGRAAMIGFFMAYLVDALTGLDLVGQTGNFICKAALLITIIGILVFRRKEDVENIQKLADEATFYDKQWKASWESTDVSNKQSSKK